jgi:hypothetical protein
MVLAGRLVFGAYFYCSELEGAIMPGFENINRQWI